jgi:hypothetical protein
MDKGAQENKLVVGSQENSLCREAAKIASALIRLLPKGYWNHCSRRDHHDVSGTDSPGKHQTSTTDRVLQPIWLFKT